jgi:glycogen debranching enzyme
LCFAADFADVFEVRGARRERRGEALPMATERAELRFAYRGLDGARRQTQVEVATPSAATVSATEIRFAPLLTPHVPWRTVVRVTCRDESERPRTRAATGAAPIADVAIASSSRSFNAWVEQSRADLRMLTARTDVEGAAIPYAGVPWFATPFGRDALIAARQVLWCDPSVARGVLLFLAEHQADRVDAAADAEPGKVLHEMRHGEMAACGEIPFGCYYGSVDATPLFVMLAAAYHERTADDATLRALWPHLLRAMAWIEDAGDVDGDGFVEYRRSTPEGLVNQGWKDSRDSISHESGALADGPIALCEVQAYAYAARVGLARVARRFGDDEQAGALEDAAERLRKRFADAFWCPDLGTFAVALDGAKRPCRVSASNAGHALFAGIASPEHAARAAHTLLGRDLWSGWGVRTLARSSARYNPLSYHNGSIWPHDNALVALGLARYGHVEGAQRIFTSLFEASRAFDDARLPELFCGFDRARGESPTRYPVACSPQAWASTVPYALIEASLGLRIDAARSQLRLHRPRLPSFVRVLEIRGLRIGEGSIDLRIAADGHPLVLRRTGAVEVVLGAPE